MTFRLVAYALALAEEAFTLGAEACRVALSWGENMRLRVEDEDE